jgi:phosphoribosyl-AMP cyclohydrolase
MKFIEELNFGDKGLIPAVIQDVVSSEVLTLCYMDREALEKTMATGKVHVYRRSKSRVMIKGETSGCTQEIKEIFVDCAGNSLLFKVMQNRAACHEGYFSCYFRKFDGDGGTVIEQKRVFDPKDVY